MDDILNIDECLSDSFSLSSDTDIRNIVDQWRHGESTTTTTKEQKYVDTRTFTRPKKKLFSHTDVNNGFGMSRSRLSSGADALVEETLSSSASSTEPSLSLSSSQPQIDLKIGGLVTSLQRSFLSDVSPPPSALMESSMEMVGNSLITSSDFSNINEFINANEESLSLAQFKNYRLSDAINDRNFLERLTNYDESLFTKDADINNIDGSNLFAHTNGNETFSGNSTLQNSTDSTSNSDKNDETFLQAKKENATFNATQVVLNRSAPETNRTFVQNDSMTVASGKNETFDAEPAKSHATFNASPQKGIAALHMETMDMLDNEEMSLQNSFDDFKKPELNIVTVTSKHIPNACQSTPARKSLAKSSRRSETLANISPILCEDVRSAGNQKQNVDKFVDVEIDDYPVLLRDTSKSDSRASNPLAVMNLREEERQSLKNFEDFENTLLMLENNKNEDEFDDMLNSIGGNANKSQKIRQSLDIIKKRHSLINMEKQYQDELSREKTLNSSRTERPSGNDTFNQSVMVSSNSSTASSSGERLLRRSRLYDDGLSTSGNQLNASSSSISSNDNKKINSECDATTDELNQRNQSHLAQENEKTEKQLTHCQYNLDEANTTATSNGESRSNNRDRFKTIRIFKKPPENAVQVPDADPEDTEPVGAAYARGPSNDHFTQKNTNSPQSSAETKAINTMTFKRSALARPKYLGGIKRRDAYTKSSSHEILSNDDYDNEPHETKKTTTAPLKSPMGVKSKSVHSLLTSNKVSLGYVRPSATASTSAYNTGTFKIPKPLSTLRQPAGPMANKKIGLIRPSSGYYNYGKRLDSDSESGRFSSNNSLSSGSSKGSLYKPEYESALNSTFATNSNSNSTFAVVPPQTHASSDAPNKLANGISGGSIPRPSGLRPPTQMRKSALPRPMTYSKR